MNKKYQVFISSTYKDLPEYRAAVVNETLTLGHFPVAMEYFAAGGIPKWEYIKQLIDASDYYAVIIADWYGSTIEEEGGISYTEKEFDYAVSKGLRPLVFLLHEDAEWPRSNTETLGNRRARLEAFKSKATNFMAANFYNADSLATKYVTALTTAIKQDPRVGWVRASAAASPETEMVLAHVSRENHNLRPRLEATDYPEDVLSQNIVQIMMQKQSVSNADWTLLDVFRAIGRELLTSGLPADFWGKHPAKLSEDVLLQPEDLTDLLALDVVRTSEYKDYEYYITFTTRGRAAFQFLYRHERLHKGQ